MLEIADLIQQRITVFGTVSNINIHDKEFIDDNEAEIHRELVLEEANFQDYTTVKGNLQDLMKNKQFLSRWKKKYRYS